MRYLEIIEAKKNSRPVTVFGDVFRVVRMDMVGDSDKRIYKITHIKDNKIHKARRVRVGVPTVSELKFIRKYFRKVDA